MYPSEQLIEAARAAMRNAYAPYSDFAVGAAIKTADGSIFTGCNVENASYGLTICAERNALFSAITAGARNFTEMVIIADTTNAPYPCGACRQVISEFCAPDFIIHVIADKNPDITEKLTSGELLPKSFTPSTIRRPQRI